MNFESAQAYNDSSPFLNPADHPNEIEKPVCKICGEVFTTQFGEEICEICEIAAGHCPPDEMKERTHRDK